LFSISVSVLFANLNRLWAQIQKGLCENKIYGT
jgi:hypothetical protein